MVPRPETVIGGPKQANHQILEMPLPLPHGSKYGGGPRWARHMVWGLLDSVLDSVLASVLKYVLESLLDFGRPGFQNCKPSTTVGARGIKIATLRTLWSPEIGKLQPLLHFGPPEAAHPKPAGPCSCGAVQLPRRTAAGPTHPKPAGPCSCEAVQLPGHANPK